MQRKADRAFVVINGLEIGDLKSANVDRNSNVQYSSTMTRNLKNSGFKYGNTDINVSLESDVDGVQAAVDTAIVNPEDSIDLVFICGGERFLVKNLAESTMSMSASVGDASKSTSYLALDIVNENGASVNISINLGQ